MNLDTEDMEHADTSRIGVRGRTEIPEELRKRLKVNIGDKVQWILMKDGTLHILFIKGKTKTGAEAVR